MSMKSSPQPAADDELNRLVALGITRQQVEPGDDCLDPEVLASYADGGLSAEERTSAEAHLARCRDCRRALAFQVESDPLVAATPAAVAASSPLAVGSPESESADDPSATTRRARGVLAWPRVVKSAKIWLPLAAALVVATGLWVAFDRSRQSASYVGSAPAQLSARNEAAAAKQAAEEAAAPRVEPPRAAPDGDAKPAGARTQREASHAPTSGGASDFPAASTELKEASRIDAVSPQPPPSTRARTAPRDEFAAAARPNAEADKRSSPPAPARASSAPAPPPPPAPPAALADAAPARAASEAGRDAQAKVAGQLAPAPPASASPASPQVPAPDQTAAANQNVAQQQAYGINQQTGPMSNLNTAPPPAKTDEQRRQADRSKNERNENEKSSGGPSGAKSADTKFAKAKEPEPKSLARAKAAPQSAAAAAAPVDAAERAAEPTSTQSASAASGKPAAGAPAAEGAAGAASNKGGGVGSASGASPTFRSGTDAPAAGGVVGGAAGAERNAAGLGAGDTSTREINEAMTVVTAAPAPGAVLRAVDGGRWWRIRGPSTIEGSTDRGANWTVEYSDPAARIVRGAPAAKGGCWMIGANGLVLRIRPNGGWERVPQPTTRNLVTLSATDHLIAAVTDDQGRTYRTIDGGATWR